MKISTRFLQRVETAFFLERRAFETGAVGKGVNFAPDLKVAKPKLMKSLFPTHYAIRLWTMLEQRLSECTM